MKERKNKNSFRNRLTTTHSQSYLLQSYMKLYVSCIYYWNLFPWILLLYLFPTFIVVLEMSIHYWGLMLITRMFTWIAYFLKRWGEVRSDIGFYLSPALYMTHSYHISRSLHFLPSDLHFPLPFLSFLSLSLSRFTSRSVFSYPPFLSLSP